MWQARQWLASVWHGEVGWSQAWSAAEGQDEVRMRNNKIRQGMAECGALGLYLAGLGLVGFAGARLSPVSYGGVGQGQAIIKFKVGSAVASPGSGEAELGDVS